MCSLYSGAKKTNFQGGAHNFAPVSAQKKCWAPPLVTLGPDQPCMQYKEQTNPVCSIKNRLTLSISIILFYL